MIIKCAICARQRLESLHVRAKFLFLTEQNNEEEEQQQGEENRTKVAKCKDPTQ